MVVHCRRMAHVGPLVGCVIMPPLEAYLGLYCIN